MNLEEKLVEYKNITSVIIETVKIEEYGKLDQIFTQRQLILEDINKSSYLKEELKKFYLQYEIEFLEEKLASDMKFKQVNLLKKIKENEQRQVGTAGYNNISAKAVFLSKQI